MANEQGFRPQENVLMMFNRYLRMAATEEQEKLRRTVETLILDMKQAYLEIQPVYVAEAVHGQWEYHWFDSYCSVCGWENKANPVTRCRDDYPYCPHCGAKMDGGSNGKE